MNIVKRLDQYREYNIYFCEPIKNNVMNEGNFIRILYSNSIFILNGIYLVFVLNINSIERYYNKYKCNFDLSLHRDMIDKIKQIEEGLLKKIIIKNKIPQFKISDQLKNGNIKIFSDNIENIENNCNFLLKISGIWETETNYGVTYKFIKITDT